MLPNTLILASLLNPICSHEGNIKSTLDNVTVDYSGFAIIVLTHFPDQQDKREYDHSRGE